MTEVQAKFIAKKLRCECGVSERFGSGGGWDVYLHIDYDLTLRLERSGLFIVTRDPGSPINTSKARSIELKVAAIEHAEELCIAAGLGDPRSKT